MNRLASGLAVASIALAVSTGWLLKKVQEERVRLGTDSPTLPSTGSLTTPAQADDDSNAAAQRKKEDGPLATSASPDAPRSGGGLFGNGRASREESLKIHNETFVRLYNDPRGRRELVEERIPPIRDRYLPLQRRLRVDDLQWQRFMEVVAERELGFNAAQADCTATNTCDRLKPTPEMFTEYQRLIAEVLGDDKAAEVRKFDNTQPERLAFNNLQSGIPENQRLPEDRAEGLLLALARIRDETAKQMNAAQVPLGQFFDARGGVLLYDKSLTTPEARVGAAADYSKRLREQAGKHLTGKLLAAFERQQDALLERMRASGGGAGP